MDGSELKHTELSDEMAQGDRCLRITGSQSQGFQERDTLPQD